MLRKSFVLAIAVMAASAIAATPALAQKPGAHIVGDLTITKSTSGLTVSGKGAGFGNTVTNAFLTAERVEAVFQCRNKGGNIAPGQGVELVDVTGPTQTITPSAGHIDFNVSLPAPPPPDPDDVCPNGNWTVDAAPLSLTFIGVTLNFEQSGQEVLIVPLGDIDP
jgi:hypothetical protein